MQTDQDHLVERRQHLAAVADDFRAHDRTMLARPSSTQLADQQRARRLVYEQVRAVGEPAKADGLDPTVQPEWISVAMLCDLAGDLWSTALGIHRTENRARS
jgi:hypothetical protein